MLRYMNALAAFLVSIGSLFVCVQTSSAQQNPVTAIDIALEPDATMIQHAGLLMHDCARFSLRATL